MAARTIYDHGLAINYGWLQFTHKISGKMDDKWRETGV